MVSKQVERKMNEPMYYLPLPHQENEKKSWTKNVLVEPYLTSFVLRVGHERFLHGFRCQNLVLLLNGGGGRRRNLFLGDDFESLHNGDVSQPLSDRQGCLAVLQMKKSKYRHLVNQKFMFQV